MADSGAPVVLSSKIPLKTLGISFSTLEVENESLPGALLLISS